MSDLDYIGVGVGLTAMSILLSASSYGLCSVKFNTILGESTTGRIAGATLLLSSLALGVVTSAIGLVTSDLPFKEFAGLSIASGVVAYALGWMINWCSKVRCSSEDGVKLHRD